MMDSSDRNRRHARVPLLVPTLFGLLACDGANDHRSAESDRAARPEVEQPIDSERERSVELPLPLAMLREDGVVLRCRVRSLPFGSRVVVISGDGEILGVIAPFGAAAYETEAWYEIPVPVRSLAESSVSLRLRLEDPNAPRNRAPTLEEISVVELAPRLH